MYDVSTRKRALALVAQGRSLNAVSKETGISRAAIRSWQDRLEPVPRMAPPLPDPPSDRVAYSYLLGLYLGDGCISAHPRGSGHYLRIACADAWPGLIDACEAAIRAVNPAHTAHRVQAQGCVSVVGYYAYWPYLFPQHGPGKKHERAIVLDPWQQAIVDEHPWEFIRGLIHSDGCRIINWTAKTIGGVRKRYEYPRYFFTNKSDDIRRLFTDTLDKVGVEWTTLARGSEPLNISIAKKPSVVLMDAHVGPKY
ncbi:helix-turn-helix domain-containing protein [Streptomyces sp. ME08-AFT2]|uniref:helix-turn-helix domain-containing protein n=1 Tax=Streptomyces sp. ME08-AFT2 TaxID=3028683 RepID=UPI0029A97D9B|nr:helix-turn-helix domain-containing protein [Streptomyces sp. ME08-AFT2]MDX3310226.1 helix-turn-helix domain-containing protein [Streptomyces sp. ME08-AFT2]